MQSEYYKDANIEINFNYLSKLMSIQFEKEIKEKGQIYERIEYQHILERLFHQILFDDDEILNFFNYLAEYGIIG